MALARAMARFSAERGQPSNGVPSGLAMSQVIAADPRAAGVAPRQHLEGVEVGLQVHVRFLDADEALDRRAVEQHGAVERLGELAIGHLDVLGHAQDVGELQAQEFHALAFGAFEDGGSWVHGLRPQV